MTTSETQHKDVLSSIKDNAEDPIVLDRTLYRYWREKWLKREMIVARKSWFDYRSLHPVTRSKLFVAEYEKAHQRAFIRFYGEPSKDDEWRMLPRAKKGLYARNPRTIATIIGYMQTVDEARLPYDMFFDGAFHHMMQDRGFTTFWKKHKALESYDLPPLTSMVNGESMIAAAKHFERKCKTKLKLPTAAKYRASNWRGTDDQKEFASWLIGEAMRRGGDMYWVLARMVYQLDLLRELEVARKLGLDAVKQLRSIKSKL